MMTLILPGNPWTLEALQTADTYSRTTLAWAQAETMVALQTSVDKSNQSRVDEYNAAFDKYQSAQADRPSATNIIPPVPALKQVIVISSEGWPGAVEGAEHVCATRVYVGPKINPNSNGLGPDGRVVNQAANWWGKVDLLSSIVIPEGVAGAGQVWMRLK